MRKVRRGALLLTLIVAGPLPGYTEEIAAQGVGALSCAEYAKLYMADPKVVDDAVTTWSQGFLSGMNMAEIVSSGMSKNLSRIDIDSYRWKVRSYCENHPLGNTMDELLSIYKSLPESKPTK